jgi:hypothetical protein
MNPGTCFACHLPSLTLSPAARGDAHQSRDQLGGRIAKSNAKSGQTNPSKNAWFGSVLFVWIGPFQWFMAKKAKKNRLTLRRLAPAMRGFYPTSRWNHSAKF